LNGQLVLTNPDWQKPTQAEVQAHLRKGSNELLVEATNKGGVAAFIASLTVRFADGSEKTILTDGSWLATAPGANDWKAAKVLGDYGAKPWGDVFNNSGVAKGRADTSPSEVIKPADVR